MTQTYLYYNFTDICNKLTLSKKEVNNYKKYFNSLLSKKNSFKTTDFSNLLEKHRYNKFEKLIYPNCEECSQNKPISKKTYCNKKHLKEAIKNNCEVVYCKEPISKSHKGFCKCAKKCLDIIIELIEEIKIAKENFKKEKKLSKKIDKKSKKTAHQKSLKIDSKNTLSNNYKALLFLSPKKTDEKLNENKVIFANVKRKSLNILNIREQRIFYALIKWIKSYGFEEDKDSSQIDKNIPYLCFKYKVEWKMDRNFSFIYQGNNFDEAWDFIWSFNKIKGNYLENCSLTEAKVRDKFFDMVDLEVNFEKEYINEENRLETSDKIPVKTSKGWNDPNHPNYRVKRPSTVLLNKNDESAIRTGKRSIIVIDDDSGKESFKFQELSPVIQKQLWKFINYYKIPYVIDSISGNLHIFVQCLEEIKMTFLCFKQGNKYYQFGDLKGEGGQVGSPRSRKRGFRKTKWWSKKKPHLNKLYVFKTADDFNAGLARFKLFPFYNIEEGAKVLKSNNVKESSKKSKKSNNKIVKNVKKESSNLVWKSVYEENIIILSKEPRIENFSNGYASNSSESMPSEHVRVFYYRKNDKLKKERSFIIDKGDEWKFEQFKKLMEFSKSKKSFNVLMDEGEKGENYRFFNDFLTDEQLKKIENKAINLATIKDQDWTKKIKHDNKNDFWIEEINNVNQRILEKTYGKWLISDSWDSIDKNWERISNAIKNNDLNVSSAKVLNKIARGKKKNGSICVYTYKNNIDLIREQLRNLEFTDLLCYKTNIATKNCLKGCWSHLICEKDNKDER